mmetsp:Transcript_45974/g.33735  ORF Transcript_45974/g.33735 Transcript_45974/m.33735 type:complete len:93 (+) Transcript_45974:906-1184(+)
MEESLEHQAFMQDPYFFGRGSGASQLDISIPEDEMKGLSTMNGAKYGLFHQNPDEEMYQEGQVECRGESGQNSFSLRMINQKMMKTGAMNSF